MKEATKSLALLAIVLCHALGATVTAEDVLLVPRAGKAPVIDGELDPVWYSSKNVLIEYCYFNTGDFDRAMELYTKFREDNSDKAPLMVNVGSPWALKRTISSYLPNQGATNPPSAVTTTSSKPQPGS